MLCNSATLLAEWRNYLCRQKMYIAAIICLSAVGIHAARAAECACATTDVHVRSGVGTSHSILGTLPSGQCVSYKGDQSSHWVHVDYNGQSGWVHGNYVNIQSCGGSTGTGGGFTCHGSHVYTARGTAYYPSNNPIEGGFVDMRGHKLNTLQDYLEGHASYVSVAMDNHAGIAYGTPICIQQLNSKYGKNIVFHVVDTGSAFFGKGHSRIDICVRSRSNSYDSTINGQLTLHFP